MKPIFTFFLFQLVFSYTLFADRSEDEAIPKPVKKHHFNWLAGLQPIIGVGKFTSHQTASGPLARFFRTTDSTYKFVNTLYMGSVKGSVGYQYKQLFYIGLGTGVQFGRQIASDSNKLVSDIMVPFFMDMRVTYGQKLQVYFQQTTGYAFYFDQYLKQNDTLFFDRQHNAGVYHNNKPWGGFFMQSSVGLKFNLKKISVSTGLGYELTYVVEKYSGFQYYYPGYPYGGTKLVLGYDGITRDLKHHILFTVDLSF